MTDEEGDLEEGNPLWARMSVATSNDINLNTAEDDVRKRWQALYDEVVTTRLRGRRLGDLSAIERTAAEYWAARVTRGSVARVLSHRFAVHLAPFAKALLAGDTSDVEAMIESGRLNLEVAGTLGVETEFHRLVRGDDARLAMTLKCLSAEPVEKTLNELPFGLGLAMTEASELDELKTRAYLDARNIDWHSLRPSDRSDYGLFDQEGRIPKKEWYKRLRILRASYIPKDPRTFLTHNVAAGGHHLTAFVGDGTRQFNLRFPDHDERLEATLCALQYTSKLSWMSNYDTGEAEWENRYVWRGEQDGDREVCLHTPLLAATEVDGRRCLAPNAESTKFHRQLAQGRGLCPGGDGVDPIGSAEDVMEELRSELIARSGRPELFAGPFTSPVVVGIAAACAVDRFIATGRMHYDAAELQALLGPPMLNHTGNSRDLAGVVPSGPSPIVNDY